MTVKRKSTRRRDRFIVGLAVLAIASGMLGALAFNPVLAKLPPANSQVAPVARASFADMIEAVSPAVVAISTSGSMAASFDMPDLQLPPGSPFEDFFKHFFQNGPPGAGGPARKFKAQGSGFIIDPKGIVVTNYHVVKGADQITVITRDGTERDATLKGYDQKTDLAVLKVKSDTDLPYVEFGNSDAARVGDPVLAIGNPFGLGGSATSGIISARGRDINAGPLDDFLQVDAPINRGNSGGPLFDASGRVIGVNTAIFSPNGGNVGIGFAIPSSLASSVVDQLVHKGHVERGWLGVQIQALTPELADSLGLHDDKGALVASVVQDSPAQRAGIKVGDVIMKFNGKSVQAMHDLPRLVADTPAGSTVNVDVWRDGAAQDLNVTVGNSATAEPVQVAQAETAPKEKLGLALAPLDDQARAHYRIGDNTSGVVVVQVDPYGPAAEQGIREGDVIKMVGNSSVSQPAQVVAEVKKAADSKHKSVLLLVERNGSDRFVAVGIA